MNSDRFVNLRDAQSLGKRWVSVVLQLDQQLSNNPKEPQCAELQSFREALELRQHLP